MHSRSGRTIAAAPAVSATAAVVLTLLLAGSCSRSLVLADASNGGDPTRGIDLARGAGVPSGTVPDRLSAPGPDEGRPLPPAPSALALERGARACIRLRCGRFLCPPGMPSPDLLPAPFPIPHGEACPGGRPPGFENEA